MPVSMLDDIQPPRNFDRGVQGDSRTDTALFLYEIDKKGAAICCIFRKFCFLFLSVINIPNEYFL